MRISEKAFTFDDVLLVPAQSESIPKEVDLATRLTREIKLNIPIVSAAMDTVTEAGLAIAIAQQGGIGIIHKNMPAKLQASEVLKVKRHESGVITDPITISPDTTIEDVIAIQQKQGFSGLPVLDGDDLVGIISRRDVRFASDLSAPASSLMSQKEKLVTVQEGTNKEQIQYLLHKNRIERVLVVDDAFKLKGMVTVKDLKKAVDFPAACKDEAERLRVGAAVGTSSENKSRVEALVTAGVDVIVVDTAHGHSQGVLDQVKWIKNNFAKIQVIGGNIATGAAAKALAQVGADGVKVGIGPGSICTTRIVAGVGVPQISAISNVVKALADTDIPAIADGGIRYSGDIAKAVAAGAHSVMVGSMLAGTKEAPGEVELFQGRSYKSYRGMGSLGAMQQGSSDRYFQDNSSGNIEKLVPEGIEGRVPYKGPMAAIVHQMLGGLRSSMGYTGCENIEKMRTKPEFVQVSNAGMVESHVHDVTITKEAPNYRR